MSKFVWGKIIDQFSYNFDGKQMEVIKYHPWKTSSETVRVGNVDMKQTLYYCEDFHLSTKNLFHLIIAFIANENLGLNQNALVTGIAKSLNCQA